MDQRKLLQKSKIGKNLKYEKPLELQGKLILPSISN